MHKTLEQALALWRYMASFASVAVADAIVICCSYDLRVADHACDLIQKGIARNLVISGNSGNWTRHLWTEPEAHVFARRAIGNGIDPKLIIIEDRASNFGENLRYSKAFLPQARTVVLVTKPNAVLRLKLTAAAQWPETNIHVSCPTLIFPEEISSYVGVLGVIDEMVGDIDRILKYPVLGYQVPHELPDQILKAYDYLIRQGFNRHCLPD